MIFYCRDERRLGSLPAWGQVPAACFILIDNNRYRTMRVRRRILAPAGCIESLPVTAQGALESRFTGRQVNLAGCFSHLSTLFPISQFWKMLRRFSR
jgi:hypothetical protein